MFSVCRSPLAVYLSLFVLEGDRQRLAAKAQLFLSPHRLEPSSSSSTSATIHPSIHSSIVDGARRGDFDKPLCCGGTNQHPPPPTPNTPSSPTKNDAERRECLHRLRRRMSSTRPRIPKALTTTLAWAPTPSGMGGFVSAGRSARAALVSSSRVRLTFL